MSTELPPILADNRTEALGLLADYSIAADGPSADAEGEAADNMSGFIQALFKINSAEIDALVHPDDPDYVQH